MVQAIRAKLGFAGLGLFFILVASGIGYPKSSSAAVASNKEPSVLIVYDGADVDGNPGRLDALYLGNLLGHFTTHRRIIPLASYRTDLWKSYDATFCIIYEKKFEVPDVFLKDIPAMNRPFCWLGHQTGQLDRVGVLRSHGLEFERFYENSPLTKVRYKKQLLDKGDPDTNILKITDPSKVQVFAEATGTTTFTAPYIIKSDNLWVVTDSPFSYSGETDRYIAFADVLHDILNISHKESHSAIMRIEDINALSDPQALKNVLTVLKHEQIPFAFGFVPVYINPSERIYTHLNEHPDLVAVLKDYIRAGGAPVIHGYTHQHRGITTDDYEFWDDIADRPVRGDSEAWAYRRVEEAIREAFEAELYPVTWETPHYAGSPATYRAVARCFNTTFERRMADVHIGTDQFFPYPVIDLKGQFVIPEDLGYIPQSDENPKILLDAAQAELVVRDGWASGFVHPFLKPSTIEKVIKGIKEMGYTFANIRSFPNRVQIPGRLSTNLDGMVKISGEGRYLNEFTFTPDGEIKSKNELEIEPVKTTSIKVSLNSDETFVALRQNTREPKMLEKIWRIAKGDVTVIPRKLETVFPGESINPSFRAMVLWNEKSEGPRSIDQTSFYEMLSNMGFETEKKMVGEFSEDDLQPFTLLVIPNASAQKLTSSQVTFITRALEEGLVLITDGESPLSTALGIHLGLPAPVHQIFDHFYGVQTLRWPDRPYVEWIDEPAPDAEGITLYYSERDARRPLVMGGTRGQGRYLYFAPLFDPISGAGYSRFPGTPFIIQNDFHLHSPLRRSAAEAYFDPGYRQNVSVERLAKMWRQFGIQTLHVAAWHFYDKYSYDYARLIKVAHQNGILVYAWFEWPHVSQRFWNDYPQWREKNALLSDAHIDWRELMNFRDPKCFEAVLKDAENLLKKYDWDGVNLAEFHFEGVANMDASKFTPFNNIDRAAFKSSYGFDPIEIFSENSTHHWKKDPASLNMLYRYRRSTNHDLLEKTLKRLDKMDHQINKDRETVLTIIDTIKNPEYDDLLGIDLPATIDLVNHTETTLQVEDPAPEWSKTPDRYYELIDHYRQMSLKHPFMVDINVLPVHSEIQKEFATVQPTGAEMLQLWHTASSKGNRVCLYSESTIFEPDWELLPYAMAAEAEVRRDGEEWIIRTPFTISLEVGRGTKRWIMDDHTWPCYSRNSVLIPPGEHHLVSSRGSSRWFDTSDLNLRLLSLSGELLGSEPTKRGLMVEYRSNGRCWATFNKEPSTLQVDDIFMKIDAMKTDEGFTLPLPSGQHRLVVNTGSAFLFVLQYLSVVSASLIVVFGGISSGLLIILYAFVRLTRRARLSEHRLKRKPSPVKN